MKNEKGFHKAPTEEAVKANMVNSAPDVGFADSEDVLLAQAYTEKFNENPPIESTQDNEMTCASTMDCTGSIPARPATEYEYAFYQELNNFAPPHPTPPSKTDKK